MNDLADPVTLGCPLTTAEAARHLLLLCDRIERVEAADLPGLAAEARRLLADLAAWDGSTAALTVRVSALLGRVSALDRVTG